jgi:tyrosinase
MPLFFPWHRRLILDYEHELQTIDPSVSLPYWGYLAREKHTSDTAH